jgi:2-polyprenyl-3-methyl-5-hydroxy-6-metoxy-1,4-benzoquinol methylase
MTNNLIAENANLCLICGRLSAYSEKQLFDTRFGLPHFYCIGACNPCGIEMTIPIPEPKNLKWLYEEYYNFNGERETRYTQLREKFLFSFLYRLWCIVDGDISFHTRKGSGRLLDIGCNEGRGLRLYQRNGYTAEGLELNEMAATIARSHGFTVYTQLIEEFCPKEQYDVTILSNVLEHSLDPKVMLRKVHHILKPGGQAWISCPNNRSWLRSVFGKYWINWHVPFHILHFSADGLKKLLTDIGFEIIETRNVTPSLWVAHSIIALFFAKPGKPTKKLRNPLIVILLMLFIRGLLFPVLWTGNRLGRGDCLVVRARKSQ